MSKPFRLFEESNSCLVCWLRVPLCGQGEAGEAWCVYPGAGGPVPTAPQPSRGHRQGSSGHQDAQQVGTSFHFSYSRGYCSIFTVPSRTLLLLAYPTVVLSIEHVGIS